MHRGWSHYVDQLRDDLWQHHPQIHIVDFDFYSMDVFNRCENTNDVLLAIPGWANVHPLLKVIPVEWEHNIPYGILHSPEPTPTVRRFLDAAKAVRKRTVRLIITQRYILMNKSETSLEVSLFYNNGRKQKVVDTMKPVSYMAIVLCVMLFLTGCSSGAVDEEVNESVQK